MNPVSYLRRRKVRRKMRDIEANMQRWEAVRTADDPGQAFWAAYKASDAVTRALVLTQLEDPRLSDTRAKILSHPGSANLYWAKLSEQTSTWRRASR